MLQHGAHSEPMAENLLHLPHLDYGNGPPSSTTIMKHWSSLPSLDASSEKEVYTAEIQAEERKDLFDAAFEKEVCPAEYELSNIEAVHLPVPKVAEHEDHSFPQVVGTETVWTDIKRDSTTRSTASAKFKDLPPLPKQAARRSLHRTRTAPIARTTPKASVARRSQATAKTRRMTITELPVEQQEKITKQKKSPMRDWKMWTVIAILLLVAILGVVLGTVLDNLARKRL